MKRTKRVQQRTRNTQSSKPIQAHLTQPIPGLPDTIVQAINRSKAA